MTNEERDKLIRETHSAVIELKTRAESTEKDISTLFKAIEGNGRPGLKQEMAVLKKSHAECQERQKRKDNQAPARNGNKLAFVAILIAVFVSPVVSAFVSVVLKSP